MLGQTTEISHNNHEYSQAISFEWEAGDYASYFSKKGEDLNQVIGKVVKMILKFRLLRHSGDQAAQTPSVDLHLLLN